MIWKDIKGWEKLYEISSTGLVRNKLTNKIIVGDTNNHGYHRVCLYNKHHNPPKQRFFRHRLVAEHFIPNPNNYSEVNHINSDKSINEIWNLEWCTRLEKGTKKYNYKPFTVIFKNGTIKQYKYKKDLAIEINVTNSCIRYWLHKDTNGYLNHGIKQIYYDNGNQNIKV